MKTSAAQRKKWRSPISMFGLLFFIVVSPLGAAERIHTAYFSPAPGASSVIWVAKEARLFEKNGLEFRAEIHRAAAKEPPKKDK